MNRPPQDVVLATPSAHDERALSEARTKFPPIWTVYDHPRDHPKHWVVRVWWGEVPEPTGKLCETLLQARRLIVSEGGSVKLAREAGDDPKIAESWI